MNGDVPQNNPLEKLIPDHPDDVAHVILSSISSFGAFHPQTIERLARYTLCNPSAHQIETMMDTFLKTHPEELLPSPQHPSTKQPIRGLAYKLRDGQYVTVWWPFALAEHDEFAGELKDAIGLKPYEKATRMGDVHIAKTADGTLLPTFRFEANDKATLQHILDYYRLPGKA